MLPEAEVLERATRWEVMAMIIDDPKQAAHPYNKANTLRQVLDNQTLSDQSCKYAKIIHERWGFDKQECFTTFFDTTYNEKALRGIGHAKFRR